ncbi:hypothetical protein [Tropicimonas isoalkanivorans]|uniref:Uncharacterized protein n=1 Tax=Tropicimonas isoalkanivorans TaxID=441112 RepID=A0A1I1GIQ1_9RHOB|nr:hypothetical protein [Tropicimonas isoalkanivorans]SFC09050.1 hypothetical protein SAMN04488094_102501 [Tropicimonas isoalkanivorans]
MTAFARTAKHPNPADVIGPYSLWPRTRAARDWKKPATIAASVSAAGVFVHCVAPILA